jgi:MFS family permease
MCRYDRRARPTRGQRKHEDHRIVTSLREHPRYAWLVALTTFLCFALSVGITQYAFSVFITELQAEFDWTRAQVSASFSFYALSAIAALPVGWLLDRFGARPVMAVSIAMLAVSHLLRPWMTELWHFYALSALQFAALPGATSMSGARLVAAWFEGNRGRWMGITAMGANVGGMTFSYLTAVLITRFGALDTYFIYGLLFAALLPMVLLVIRERPIRRTADGTEDTAPREVTGVLMREALRTRTFVLVAVGLVLAQLTYQSLMPQIVPHLENVGISRSDAALGLSLMAFFGMLGKLVLGSFSDRYPARYALVISLTTQVVGVVIILTAGTSMLVWLFVPVFGFGFGAFGAIMPLLVQQTFGLRSFGTILGSISFLTLVPALIGPPLVGASFDATGSYQIAFLTISGLFIVAAIALAATRPMAARPAVEVVGAR